MGINKSSKIIALISAGIMIANDISSAGHFAVYPCGGSALAVMPAADRGVDLSLREAAYKKEFNEKLSPVYGGKASWDIILERLSGKIGYYVPGSVRFSIKDIWAKFIEANRALVDEGNKLVLDEQRLYGKISNETADRLNKLICKFDFPKELESLIAYRAKDIKGWILARSSGRNEDSYIRNLAGIFTSPKRFVSGRKKDERLAACAVREMFDHAVREIWTPELKKEKKIDGVPEILTAEEGFGVVMQPFIQFDASGTAMTNLYGHTSIEAVFGDAEMAVKSIHANTVQFLFDKNDPSRYEFSPSYISLPYQARIKGKEYTVNDNHKELADIIRGYPVVDGKHSPVTKEQAAELNRVVNALEDEIGVPLDVEWGFLEGKLCLLQIRPIIGDLRKPLVEMSDTLRTQKPVAATPVAIGHTTPDGFKAKMVCIGDGVPRDAVKQFEEEFGREYIRVENNVDFNVHNTDTTAKVLIDPGQGAKQAHNINLIMDRIAAEEFVYCNGPVLKEGLLRNVVFMPHPDIPGIWVSEGDVTYFGDGLHGKFFADLPSKTASKKDVTGCDKMLAAKRAYDNVMKAVFTGEDGVSGDSDPISIALRISDFISEEILKYAVWDYEKLLQGGSEMERIIALMEYFEGRGSMSMAINLERLDALKIAVEFPLWPDDWDLKWMPLLKKITGFPDSYKRHIKNKAEKAALPRDKTFRAIFYDEHNACGEIENNINKLGNTDVRRFVRPYRILFERQLDEWDYDADFVFIHMAGKDHEMKILSEINKIRKKNPGAVIVVESTGAYTTALKEFHDKRYIVLVDEETPLKDRHRELMDNCYGKWSEKQKPAESKTVTVPKAAVSGDEKSISSKFNVLFVNDYEAVLETMKNRLSLGLGLSQDEKGYIDGEDCRIYFVSTSVEAKKIMADKRIDYIIADWMLASDTETAYGLLEYAKSIGIRRVDIMTAAPQYVQQAKETFPMFDIGKYPYSVLEEFTESQVNSIKSAREEHLRRFEKMLSAEKPERPKKLRALFVDEAYEKNPDLELIERDDMHVGFGTGEFDVSFAGSMAEALSIMQGHTFDLVVFDADLEEPDAEVIAKYGNFYKKSAENSLPVIMSDSSDKAHVKMKLASKFGVDIANRLHIRFKPMRASDKRSLLEEYRKRQLDLYEVFLADWEALHKNDPPQETGKFKVLIASDKVTDELAYDMIDELGEDKYEFHYAGDYPSSFEVIWNNRIDAVIFDWIMPDDVTSAPYADEVFRGKSLPEDMNDGIFSELFIKGLRNIPFIKVTTLARGSDVKRGLNDIGGPELAKRTGITDSYDAHAFSIFLKEWREEWLKARKVQESSAGREEKKDTIREIPPKLGVLILEDDEGVMRSMKRNFKHEFASEDYNIHFADSFVEGSSIMDQHDISLVTVDLNLREKGKMKFCSKLKKIKDIIVQSGFTVGKEDRKKEVSRKLGAAIAERADIRDKTEAGLIEYLLETVKKARENQMAKWEADHPGDAILKTEMKKEGKTVFVLANSSGEGKALAEFITATAKEPCSVTTMDSISAFEKELSLTEPDVVVADIMITSKNEAKNVIGLVVKKNPKAKVILMGEQSVKLTDDEEWNVAAKLDKPFHFRNVVDAIDGEYADSVLGANARFVIDESVRIVNEFDKSHTPDDQGLVMMWEGYAAPQFQKNMISRIRANTKEGPYMIDFEESIDALIDIAEKNAGNNNAVTIMPFNMLTDEQKARIEKSGAHVIFVEFMSERSPEIDDITQLGAIIFTGIAYLNGNDGAFGELYELLTGFVGPDITIEQLKKDPKLLVFVIEPIGIYDHNRLKEMNSLMEREILKAA